MNTVNGTSTEKINNNEFSNQGRYLTDFQRKLLEKSGQNPSLGERYRQRLQIMLLADEGKSQSEICQMVGCCHGTARHWILMARTGQAHNWQEQPIGRPKAINEDYLNRLKQLVTQSPKDYGYAFSRWTAKWLSNHLAKELGIEISDRHINRLLKQMGLSTRTSSVETQSYKTFHQNPKQILINDLACNANLETQQMWPVQAFN